MADRFKLLEGSSHCCFTWMIVDTARPVPEDGSRPMAFHDDALYEIVCEGYAEDYARAVVRALNVDGKLSER